MRARDFPMVPALKSAWVLIAGLLFVAPASILAFVLATRGVDASLGAGGVTLLVFMIGFGLLWSMRRLGLRLDGDHLEIRAAVYSRRVGLDEIDLESAKVIRVPDGEHVKILVKTNGFALPGFHAGHFRCALRTRAFCAFADRDRVLMLPMKDGSLLLLGPESPGTVLEALKQAGRATP